MGREERRGDEDVDVNKDCSDRDGSRPWGHFLLLMRAAARCGSREKRRVMYMCKEFVAQYAPCASCSVIDMLLERKEVLRRRGFLEQSCGKTSSTIIQRRGAQHLMSTHRLQQDSL